MSAYADELDERGRANLRSHRLGVAVLGVLLENDQLSRFMDGDTVNRLVDRCIANPDEATIAGLLRSDFDAGFGVYELAEWFPGDDAGAYAERIVAALESTERGLS